MSMRYLLMSFALWVAVVATDLSRAADPCYDSPEAAKADPDFAVQGEYAGKDLGVQVIALGDGQFRAVVYRGGLPAAGWNRKEKQAIEGDAQEVQDIVKGMQRVERKSPTLGAKPPKGAVVLFDGTEPSLKKHWAEGARITNDGLLMQGCTSIDKFQDFSLHIEFRIPFEPKARGQARGNSGIYYQGRYETQMLDSFGLEGKNNETGGIYEVHDPNVNACLPPLVWQTYDADFIAARYDADGQKISNATLTVRLNGILVHQDAEIPNPTRAAPLGESPEPGPIYLQDHGNPVRFRNIWVLPRDLQAESRRPIVPGFERFHATGAADPAAGGRLLLGELNCTSCHAANGALAAAIRPKQAPILDSVGGRVRPEYLARFIADPHSVKPGTTMPSLLDGVNSAQRNEAVTALVNFLMTTGRFSEQASNRKFAQNGEQIFHETGCVACHLPRNGEKAAAATSIPLVALEEKYSIPSLTEFLKNPHAVRPSGRMPSFNFDNDAARDVANYLLGDVELRSRNPNMRYAVYEGSWDNVPNYDDIKPVKTGESAGLDLNVAGRTSNFGMRFEGFLKIEKEGEYRFHLGSDDGSLLFIDGEKTADNNGVHPHTVNSGTKRLTKGMHPIRVDYAQVGGEWTLELQYEGPGIPRQPADAAISMTEAGNPQPEPREEQKDGFVFDDSQVEKGRHLFASLGCTACHVLRQNGQPLAASGSAKPLADADVTKGCLAEEFDPKTPNFDLTNAQRDALAAAVTKPLSDAALQPAANVHQAMLALNCYACHARGGLGGPTQDRDPLFKTTIPEMGDEARIPPPLDGVGDKLQEDWLKNILANGAKDRPYMLTRMPKFGAENVGQLAPLFTALDQRTEAEIPQLADPLHRIKSTGRHLVGDKALACIKCHTFGKHRATGVQAINLHLMTNRIREDWFFRYLPNPPEYRPGTRMPSGFPNGRSTVTDVYESAPAQQIAAMWTYLKDGNKAGIPDGLIANMIELKPETEPIIYRNFLSGLSPRGIAVGYPERCNLAWDANNLGLTLVWHGKFIDASMHWNGRGDGSQSPLGDHVMKLETVVPIAVLDSPEASWPNQPPKQRGYRFRGYRLDDQRRPAFLYATDTFEVEDFPIPVARDGEGVFHRQLTITGKGPLEGLHFLAASGNVKAAGDGWYMLDDMLRIHIEGGQPRLRQSGGKTELLVPITLTNGHAQIFQHIVW